VERFEELYKFWFATIEDSQPYIDQQIKIWFRRDPQQDAYIRKHFIPSLSTKHENWEGERGILTRIILLDQVPRNAYRNTRLAHIYDSVALKLCLKHLNTELEQNLHSVEKLFLYLPLQHAEALVMQKLSVEKFNVLLQDAPLALRPFFAICKQMADLHYEVIEKFGRFPHRNQYLSRKSTPAELACLQDSRYHF
jgi:uncharacterized protein (DUF924 family)